MPRNAASSITLVKKVRNSTCAGNQRMQASSRNRTSTLATNTSRRWRMRAHSNERGPASVSDPPNPGLFADPGLCAAEQRDADVAAQIEFLAVVDDANLALVGLLP